MLQDVVKSELALFCVYCAGGLLHVCPHLKSLDNGSGSYKSSSSVPTAARKSDLWMADSQCGLSLYSSGSRAKVKLEKSKMCLMMENMINIPQIQCHVLYILVLCEVLNLTM